MLHMEQLSVKVPLLTVPIVMLLTSVGTLIQVQHLPQLATALAVVLNVN